MVSVFHGCAQPLRPLRADFYGASAHSVIMVWNDLLPRKKPL